MPTFQSKKYVPSSSSGSASHRLRQAVSKHPFLLFGLPFLATMLAGSFFLTPATALRYERYDNKVKRLSQEEGLGLGANKRKIDMREEYYVSLFRKACGSLACSFSSRGMKRSAVRGLAHAWGGHCAAKGARCCVAQGSWRNGRRV